jgi:hypothetical protein
MLLSYYGDIDSNRIGMTWRGEHMRTIRVSLAALLLLPLASIAQETDYSKIEIKVTHVSGNIYLLQGGDGGNMAASVGEDGIVLVDDEFAPLAAKIDPRGPDRGSDEKGEASCPMERQVFKRFRDCGRLHRDAVQLADASAAHAVREAQLKRRSAARPNSR